ncbi:hypothetical protein [Salipiger abyssi]|uniref:hypothetical protein n=1 Tax=Salipiger abyssi TaxID=1250539 RepID=UPI001A8F2FEE|nr:hypothetical protein [Salipiger abyssi]MBN9886278.1 hypothetical protein [Salipiger abyssi]
MTFSAFLAGLAIYLTLQTVAASMLGLGLWTIVVLDVAALFLAQLIYLVVIFAMVRRQDANREDATHEARRRTGEDAFPT